MRLKTKNKKKKLFLEMFSIYVADLKSMFFCCLFWMPVDYVTIQSLKTLRNHLMWNLLVVRKWLNFNEYRLLHRFLQSWFGSHNKQTWLFFSHFLKNVTKINLKWNSWNHIYQHFFLSILYENMLIKLNNDSKDLLKQTLRHIIGIN